MPIKKIFLLLNYFKAVFGILYLKCLGVEFRRGLVLYGIPSVHLCQGSQIIIGNDAVLCSDSRFTALALNHSVKISTIRPSAQITIGDNVGISGACIVSAISISIGSDALIGANALIIDTDFHPVAPLNRRHSDDHSKIGISPVSIGDNVFIGAGAKILKGVTIASDSIVSAGAVVVSGVYPAGSIISGNPAKVIGTVYAVS